MRKRIEKLFLWCGFDGELACAFSWLIALGLVFALGLQLAWGFWDADDEKKCRIYSIRDFVYTPGYALGCNLAKKRFDVKLNP